MAAAAAAVGIGKAVEEGPEVVPAIEGAVHDPGHENATSGGDRGRGVATEGAGPAVVTAGGAPGAGRIITDVQERETILQITNLRNLFLEINFKLEPRC